MGPGELNRVVVRSIALSLMLALFAALFGGFYAGAGLAFGGIWSALNFWALQGLIQSLVKRQTVKAVLFAQLKLPVLYGVGGLILVFVPISIPFGLIGFHVPFLLAGIESYRCQKIDELNKQKDLTQNGHSNKD